MLVDPLTLSIPLGQLEANDQLSLREIQAEVTSSCGKPAFEAVHPCLGYEMGTE